MNCARTRSFWLTLMPLVALTGCPRRSTSPPVSPPAPPPVVVTVPDESCLEGQPSPPIPAERIRLLVEGMRARCLNADGSMRSSSAPCLTVGEAFEMADAFGRVIVWSMTAETLCRAPVARMGGV